MDNINTKKELPVILIPAYNPDMTLVQVVVGLEKLGFTRFIVVNDGSRPECEHIFDALMGCYVVCKHETNQGKGRALKTGFKRFCEEFPEEFIITVDADGQHDPASVMAVAEKLMAQPHDLILGVRDFSQLHIPLKNRIGNLLTRRIVRWLIGSPITDTQTGLRGMNKESVRRFLDVAGERYEYETNMLLACKKNHIQITETPISAVYIDDNKSSHFHVIRDSFMIYMQLLKFASASIIATVIDIGLVVVFMDVFAKGETFGIVQASYVATAAARIISMLVNYFLNHDKVFHSQKTKIRTFIPYAVLVALNILVSSWILSVGVLHTPLPVFLIKAVISGGLFFVNYYVQKRWVF